MESIATIRARRALLTTLVLGCAWLAGCTTLDAQPGDPGYRDSRYPPYEQTQRPKTAVSARSTVRPKS